MTQSAYDRLLDRLRADGRTVRETRAGQAQAHCPAHGDAQASLSLTKIKQQALMYCHAGCETKDVLAALGWKMRDLFDNPRGTSYDYINTAGERVRTVFRTPGKRFTQSVHSNGQEPTLYRLPEAISASRPARSSICQRVKRSARAGVHRRGRYHGTDGCCELRQG